MDNNITIDERHFYLMDRVLPVNLSYADKAQLACELYHDVLYYAENDGTKIELADSIDKIAGKYFDQYYNGRIGIEQELFEQEQLTDTMWERSALPDTEDEPVIQQVEE